MGVAAANWSLPTWIACTVIKPTPVNFSVDAVRVAGPLFTRKLTGRLDEQVALSVRSPWLLYRSGMALNVMVCAAF